MSAASGPSTFGSGASAVERMEVDTIREAWDASQQLYLAAMGSWWDGIPGYRGGRPVMAPAFVVQSAETGVFHVAYVDTETTEVRVVELVVAEAVVPLG